LLSPNADHAVSDAQMYGNALLKFISPNNVGATGSHECGYYMPKTIYPDFMPFPPDKDKKYEHFVEITWQDGRVTESRFIWYGEKTRREYRLTRFGDDFPYLTKDTIGNLLVLIKVGEKKFNAYVLDEEDDIEGVQEALGVRVYKSWGFYKPGDDLPLESVTRCIARKLLDAAARMDAFPPGLEMAQITQQAIETCDRKHGLRTSDKLLMDGVKNEFFLFQAMEKRIRHKDIHRMFSTIDEFLTTAQSILQSRKARAGNSLEHHVEYVFKRAGLIFDPQPKIDGNPDFIFPSAQAYHEGSNDVIVVGVKRTCKDRWRQVLNEAPRIKKKYILTLQPGISPKQLQQMNEANVTLIIPAVLKQQYPKDSPCEILTVQQFIDHVKKTGRGGPQQCQMF